MPEYHAYVLDEFGQISQAAIFIHEETDEAAIEAAWQLVGEHDIDLWQGDRRVITLRHEERPAASQ